MELFPHCCECVDLFDREGHLPIVQYLLQQDSLLWDTASKNGRTPLHTAALHGHNDVLEYMLNICGYETDMKDSCGSTPFMDTIRIQDIDTAKLLISKHKADVTVEDNLGRQAIHVASQTGAFKSIQYLVKVCKVDPSVTCSGNGASALHIAAKEGHVSVLRMLLDFGIDSNITDAKERTALHIAAGAQHADCVCVLLQHGADCRVDCSGTSPKQLAVKQEVKQVFEDFEGT
ncbi:ankyrin repeat domain-containing protein 16-like isoform X2 [Mercenaria mercenaria]|uniref:ankyrin repeat domain-containing protein 16-like isoform X2 n=1 Tax=Mercenaria mercenaria TaxID=6596 RepID=UPI00234E38EC|nr:ankyrin repeat domain-containing protein 16-like isoform X2 [Mercenaria mercenaria]